MVQSNNDVRNQGVYQKDSGAGTALLGAAALGGAGALAWKILRKGKGGAPKNGGMLPPPGGGGGGGGGPHPSNPKLSPPTEDNIIYQGTVENMQRQKEAVQAQNLQNDIAKIKSRRGQRGPVVEGNYEELGAYAHFKPQGFLQSAVDEGSLKKTRVGLSTYLSKNPDNFGDEVSHAMQFGQNKFGSKLWDTHKDLGGRSLEQDPSKWTKDYLGYLKSDLRENFSQERFNHIIDVGKHVRPRKQQ